MTLVGAQPECEGFDVWCRFVEVVHVFWRANGHVFSLQEQSPDDSCLNKKGFETCELRQAFLQKQRPRPTAGYINHGLFRHEISEVCTKKLLRCPETADTSLYFEASRTGLAVTQQSDFQLALPPRCECKFCFFASWDYLQGLWACGNNLQDFHAKVLCSERKSGPSKFGCRKLRQIS